MPVYVLHERRSPRQLGWAAYFRLAILGVIVAGLVGLLVFVGLAFALVGAGASLAAALVYAVRRNLAGPAPDPAPAHDPSSMQSSTEAVRTIEVDEVIIRR